MKALVFSDTHDNTSFMQDVISRKRPDVIIHLGDHSYDADDMKKVFPDIPTYSVRGNCDYLSNAPDYDVVPLGNIKAFITHGHLYNVKSSVDSLIYKAMEMECTLALFGHTHKRFHEDVAGIKLLNPGTAGKGRDLSCLMLEILDNNGLKVSFL